ncbi:VOC family protein [Sedimentitalea sp. XS_ASV28]|uniref:VOC family protein n=1 Tax=Sedimentitalea sp. XS_ASV28 TaxID=3241296 RepID=UPI003511A3FB
MNTTSEHALVWAELPVRDLDKATAFYAETTGGTLTRQEDGPNPIAVFQTPGRGVALHLYPGEPAGDGRGPTLHLSSVGTLEDTLERVKQAGGEVISPIIEIPPGRFFYTKDPDGNSIGFFETRS